MIYRLRYCNKDGVEARVDIQKGLATPVIEVEGTERPFILSYNNDKGNKSGMFLSSSADIEIYETTDFNIDNLKTSNETELSVTYYINNVISWQGFIIPDFFSIEVRNNPVITMTASDRLGTLKNVTLSDLPTMVNLRELAVLCLSKTGLSLPLKTIADFSNDGTVNAFFSYYVDSQRIKDIKGRSISCYDILSSILIASNSKLVQRAGEWVIINKLQHEIGSGKIYSSLSSFTNYLENIYNFEEVSIGARRTIMPVAGSVGIYHEHGGRKSHPANYDYSLGLSGWNSVNGFVATIENRHIIGFLGGTPLFDPDRIVKQYLLNYNNWIDDTNNLNTAPYISTDPIQINSPRAYRVEVTVDISSTMAEKLSSNTAISFLRYAVILTNGVKTYTLTKAGIFEILDPENISGHSLLLRGGQQSPLLLASPSFSNSESLKGLFEVGEDDDVNNYSATIRVYGSGNQYVTVNYALIKFSDVSELPKGTMYKTEQGEVFTKAYDIETSIFGDYLLSGLDGYFYRYPNDDTSSIYKDVNTLSSPIWTTPSIPNETSELPLLHHSMRQMRRMFSVAHDLLSAEIEVSDFDPLAIFVACEKRYTVVSAQFDFFKSNLSAELEEVAFQSANVRDFIYSYFGDGESGIKSIGGISGGTGGGVGTGGGLTPEQLEILSFWKKDPNNPNTIFTEMNAYSKLELSAYGVGDGGGDGGSDYERLDTWASYDSSKSGWVLSALLGNDLNTRVTAIDGRVTDLENSAGSGSVTSVGISVPTGLSVSNSPITSSGVIAIGLQTGYSIPTTVKQGQWDTAYGWGNHSAQNYFKSTYLIASTIGAEGYDANNANLTGGFVGSYYSNRWITNGAFNGYGGLITWRGNVGTGLKLQMQYDVGHLNPTGGRLAFRTSYNNSGEMFTNWKTLWHSGDFTSTEITNWNTAFTNTHTHANKTQLDLITQSNIDVLARLSIVNGNLQINGNAYATGELSAYGVGTGGGGGGGIIDTVYGYGNLGQTFNNSILTDTFNAYTINQINTRLVAVESGSALTVNTTGTGNAITSISKAGSVITANKDLAFLETSIFNTHNNDNVRHITGAERTKWDTVVTDFAGLEIGGRNLFIASKNILDGALVASIYPSVIANSSAVTITAKVEKNTTYTISRKGLGNRFSVGFTKEETFPKIGDLTYGFLNTTDEQTKATFTTDGDAEWVVVYCGVSQGIQVVLDDNYKIEKGNIPTDWTPAPEDQVSDWNTTDVNSFSFIKNKPSTFAPSAHSHPITDVTGLQNALNGKLNKANGRVDGRIGFNLDGLEKWYIDVNNNSGFAFSEYGVASRFLIASGGNVGIGTTNPSYKLDVSGTGRFTGNVTAPKVIFNSAGWSMEQVGSELQLKYNNLIAARFLADGSIVGLGEITAYGATTGGEGVSLLRTGGTMTGNLTMSADIIMNSGRAIGVSNLPLKLLGNALTYNASNVLTEANTATQIKMGNGWTIEQTTSALTIKKNGVVKGTFND